MEFLERNKIVHGDLATRNILLANDGTVAKVSDFGLSRSLYSSVEELSNPSSGLPVRWMAPEVLTMRQVTNKSDIWSFGVLMWEIFSLGAVPYPEISKIDVQFIQVDFYSIITFDKYQRLGFERWSENTWGCPV